MRCMHGSITRRWLAKWWSMRVHRAIDAPSSDERQSAPRPGAALETRLAVPHVPCNSEDPQHASRQIHHQIPGGNDRAYTEPVHLLAAMLRQADGPRALLQRAGANVPGLLAAAEAAVKRLPQVQGNE